MRQNLKRDDMKSNSKLTPKDLAMIIMTKLVLLLHVYDDGSGDDCKIGKHPIPDLQGHVIVY